MKKSILFIGAVPPPYHGVSVANAILLNSKLMEKYIVIHIDNAKKKNIKEIGEKSIRNYWLNLIVIGEIIWKLLSTKIDIVYIQLSQNKLGFLRDYIYILAAKIFRKKILYHLHGGYFKKFYEESGSILKYFIKFSLKNCSGVIVLGQSLIHIFKDLVPGDRIFVVENGISQHVIDKNKFKDRYETHNIKVIYLGTLVESKGVLDILHAIPLIVEKCNNVEFIFVGSWQNIEEKNRALTYIRSQGIEGYVNFLGNKTGLEKEEILNNAHIFVLPTYYIFEGQPLVLIEAMASGLPIITTNQGCITEMIEDGYNGFIVKQRDINQIADKIIQFVENKDLCIQMGENNIKKYYDKYTAEHFCERFIRVVERINE